MVAYLDYPLQKNIMISFNKFYGWDMYVCIIHEEGTYVIQNRRDRNRQVRQGTGEKDAEVFRGTD